MGRLNHKRGQPSNYRQSIKSNPYWDEVKKRIRLRDDFKCVECGSTIRLETHHISYYVNGQSIVGHELDHLNWLVTLCETCHDKSHSDENHKYNPKNSNKTKR
ncbi:HNH endonuclease [Flavobacterium kingsejongi]|uniref:HNH domain-containing protein n=1 Tax=Flavobacterium kingsejongi TaxID=1678728 RepID=A0A2S1LQI4_9FLAO|nr:HNH endonuclease [Flavobacterium kingsejongi]AWG26023.1 hypothetical protein FK004_12705 [Flavobacterium kingsejongi]